MIRGGKVVAREKLALAAHRAALRGSELPPPNDAPKGTFLHGFFLPFTLIAKTMRDRELRAPYLRVALLRGLVVAIIGAIAIARGSISPREKSHGPGPSVVVHKSKHDKSKREGGEKHAPVHVDLPGLKVDLDDDHEDPKVSVLGKELPVVVDDESAPPAASTPAASTPAASAPAASTPVASARIVPSGIPRPTIEAPMIEPPAIAPPEGRSTAEDAAPKEPPSRARRAWNVVRHSWAWLLALVAFLSAVEGVVVFFSRRWDDWLSFHASRLAAIRPEDETPKTPQLALDFGWLYRKLKRRVRGYVVFAAGIPALLPLLVVPRAGEVLFTLAMSVWGYYWLGVFTAAKSAHAWADEAEALPPMPIRTLNERVSPSAAFAPLRWYGRLWAKITHSVNPAATTFERSPAAFLGLALARVILSLPGLYLLARPIVPVAAGRLCAEVHPAERFSAPSAAASPTATGATATAA